MLIKKLCLGAFCLGTFTAALAQTVPPAAVAAPAARMKQANQPNTEPSAFKNYRAFKADESLQDWRAANDAVELLGGHMGHVRNKPVPTDAAQPTAPKAKP